MRARRLAVTAITALLTLIAVPALSGCSAGKDAVDQTAGGGNRFVAGDGTVQRYPVGKRPAAPKLSGELLDGSRYDLADHQGDVIVVNFWASWCAPCRAEAADLENVYQASKADGVTFLGINHRDDRDKAKAFVLGRSTYPSLFDPPGKYALAFTDVPPVSTPATLVIDRNGRVAAIFRKAVLSDELQPVVSQVAGEGR